MECSPAWNVKSMTETIAAPWKHAVMKRTWLGLGLGLELAVIKRTCAVPQRPGSRGASGTMDSGTVERTSRHPAA